MSTHVLSILVFGAGIAAAQDGPLEPSDVLTRPEIAEVQMAPDGRSVVFAKQVRDLRAGRLRTSVWLVRTGVQKIDSLPIEPRASNLRWHPNGREITYLTPGDDGTTQVWKYTAAGGPEQLTTHPSSIASFEWSCDGHRLAFTVVKELEARPGPAVDQSGIVIDITRFDHGRLLANQPLRQRDAHVDQPRTRAELWVHDIGADSSHRVGLNGSVTGYAWAPNGRWLAITAYRKVGPLPQWYSPHDLLVYRSEEQRLQVLEQGHGDDRVENSTMLSSPFWGPDSRRIAYFRRDYRDRWASSPQVGIFSLEEGRTTFVIPADDSFQLYQPRGFWLQPDTVLIESTYRAGRRLFAVALEDASVSSVIDSNDWFDQHSFSSDGRLVAFTRQRIDTPPDLYVSDHAMHRARRLTSLHTDLRRDARPRVELVRWKGQDGVDVEGWLYLPRDGSPPFPTVVFIHGGPSPVVGNRYEPYLRVWSHGFGVYAARGIAVFVPNYRGTASFGKSFRTFAALDAEPVSDVVAGIDTLVRRGIADADRLGIAGHSNGCWLGALIAVRERRFVAAALAEGTGNWASTYARNPGFAGLQIIEHYVGHGASPYEAPERYRRQSPVYGFDGVQTAFLFEAGELGAALPAVEYAVAASSAGVPHELVIYRNTGHATTGPGTMLEVMQRNLDWFEFWLLDRKPSDDSNGRYDRWRKLRDLTTRGTG